MSRLTIAYFTSRKDPRIGWFLDSLDRQVSKDDRADLQLLIIDRYAWAPKMVEGVIDDPVGINLRGHRVLDPERMKMVQDTVNDRFQFIHIPPKPIAYCGPWRQTKTDWFCAANARNTALIFADGDYFVGVDDLSVLMPGWFDQVKHAAQSRYCVCGAYKKVLDLGVHEGRVTDYSEVASGIDSRWRHGSEAGIVPWTGAGLYGCSFGIPTNLALDICGFAFECNGLGMEDYEFGIRAERAGGKFFYNRNMLTLESEEAHHEESALRRESRVVTNKYFLPTGYTENRMADHVLTNRVRSETRVMPLIAEDLHDLRRCWRETFALPLNLDPAYSWIDLKPLSEL